MNQRQARKELLQAAIASGRAEIIQIEHEETAEADTLAALVALQIDGYTETTAARKEKFHSLARRRLRQLANELGLTAKDYDLRTNRGGIAVTGETTLHTDTLYVQISAGLCGLGEVMFRAVNGRKDYTGRHNHFAPAGALDDPAEFAEYLRQTARFGFSID